MSKVPPIGERWLLSQFKEWRENEIIPVSLELTVPHLKGYWWPKGRFREMILAELWEINQEIREKYGRDHRAWNTLLSTLSDENGKEYLTHGPEELERIRREEEEHADKVHADSQARDQTECKRRSEHERIISKCACALPCRECFEALTRVDKADFRTFYEAIKAAVPKTPEDAPSGSLGTRLRRDRFFRQQKRFNPYCRKQEIYPETARYLANKVVPEFTDPFRPENLQGTSRPEQEREGQRKAES